MNKINACKAKSTAKEDPWAFIASADLSVISVNCAVLDHSEALGKQQFINRNENVYIPFLKHLFSLFHIHCTLMSSDSHSFHMEVPEVCQMDIGSHRGAAERSQTFLYCRYL